jgi:hypothetical protein
VIRIDWFPARSSWNKPLRLSVTSSLLKNCSADLYDIGNCECALKFLSDFFKEDSSTQHHGLLVYHKLLFLDVPDSNLDPLVAAADAGCEISCV